ncbi:MULTISPECIES: hypothetical protein [Mumia]|uniref:hypothetical protein n=1 Tax=Mumia TaxID=1546255 RepID=UPI00141F4ECC|nr:hypothetical protein [Mumia sp. ZJ430]
MTARPPLPHPPLLGVDPDVALRLAQELVARRARAYAGGRHEPALTVWAYDTARATPLGRWSASPRVAGKLDGWLRGEIMRRLLGPYDDASRWPLAVWERTGALRPSADDLAWHTAWLRHATTTPVQPLLVVTHAGWLSLPDGTTWRQRRARA